MRVTAAALVLVLCLTANAHADGERIYNRECAACHMAEGRGAPQVAPPLRGHAACLARQPGGRAYLAGVLKHGLEGPITVEGMLFDGYMPAMTSLSSGEKAAVLNYLVALGGRCAERIESFTEPEIDAALNEEKWDSQTMRAVREQLGPEPATPGANTSRVRPGQVAHNNQAAEDFALHCQGCHSPEGRAIPGRVPALKESVGLFLHTAEGRAFLVKVPGVAFAPLDDQRLASLLNWMMESFSAAQLPAFLAPYGAAEVAAYRQQALVDVDAARARVVAQLLDSGLRPAD